MNVAQTSLDPPHFPVMLKEIIEICSPKKGGNFVDCTFGSGGYIKDILKFTIKIKKYKNNLNHQRHNFNL